MTPETEKLEDALNWLKDRINTKERVKASLDWQDMKAEADYEKMNIDNLKVIEQAARRYAEVMPLLGAIIKGMDLHNGSKFISKIHGEFTPINVTLTKGQIKQIAAIVARGIDGT